jgi:hypothetical protein
MNQDGNSLTAIIPGAEAINLFWKNSLSTLSNLSRFTVKCWTRVDNVNSVKRTSLFGNMPPCISTMPYRS